MAGHRRRRDRPLQGALRAQRRADAASARIEDARTPLARLSRAHDAFRAAAALAPPQIREQFADRAVRELVATTDDLTRLMNGDPE
jgi:hypothetical protein